MVFPGAEREIMESCVVGPGFQSGKIKVPEMDCVDHCTPR